MIFTVTSVTAQAVSTPSVAGSLTLIAILLVITLLIQKEIASSVDEVWARRLSRALDVALVPAFFAGVLIAATSVAGWLR